MTPIPEALKEGIASLLHHSGALAAGRALARSRHAAEARSAPQSPGRSGPPFLVLIYHRVSDRIDPFSIVPMPVPLFERQVRHLARRYHVLTLREIRTRIENRDPLPAGTVAITFDDGYRDNYEHAWPVLRRHGVPATVFLTAGLVGTAIAPWYDRVLALLRDTRAPRIEIPRLGFATDLATPESRLRAAHRLLERIKYLAPPEPEPILAELETLLGPSRPGDRLMLSWDEVRAMRDEGAELGAHTLTHRILTSVAPDEAWNEIAASKDRIERELGEPVAGFAYPNGNLQDFSDAIAALVARAGFTYAVTNVRGGNGVEADPYRWRRESAMGESLPRFALHLLRSLDGPAARSAPELL